MRSYVVQFCNRAAKDAKEINVFFEGSEKRYFATFLKFIRKNCTFMKKIANLHKQNRCIYKNTKRT